MVAGSGDYQATGVGSEAYAGKLSAQARQFTVVRSELVAGTNRILRFITWATVPVAVLLLASQLHEHASARDAVTGTVAALVGMVPQGLVLRRASRSAFRRHAARRQVLVSSFSRRRGLGQGGRRVLDKTGTLTDGTIAFARLVVLADYPIRLRWARSPTTWIATPPWPR